MSESVSRGPPMKTCPNCGTQAYPATRRCKAEGCGWNFILKVLDKDGSIAAANPRPPQRRHTGDPSSYAPSSAAAPSYSSSAGGARAPPPSAASAAALNGPPLPAVSRSGNVTSHNFISPEDDGNMDTCIMCGDMGTLICCDICPRSYHPDCAGLSAVPQGFWACPQCVAKSLGAPNGGEGGVGQGVRAGAAASGAGGHGAAGGVSVSPSSHLPSAGMGFGLQAGLDAFHQRLNSCLDYSKAEKYEMDGFVFQCFPPPNTTEGSSSPQKKQASAQNSAASPAPPVQTTSA